MKAERRVQHRCIENEQDLQDLSVNSVELTDIFLIPQGKAHG